MPNALYSLDRQGKLVHTEERRGDDGLATICETAVGDSQRQFAVCELTLTPHRRTQLPHMGDAQNAAIYILEGTLAVRLAEQTFTVNPGNMVLVGSESTCLVWNPTSATARCLVMVWAPPVE
jgi:uncharacterized cupin superfamily protein